MSSQTEQKTKIWTKGFILITCTNLLLFLSFHMQSATFSYYVLDLGGDEAKAGLVAILFSVASVLLRPIAGWLLDSKSRRLVLLWGMLGMAIMPLIHAFTVLLLLAAAMRTLQGVAWGLSATATNTIACDMIPPRHFSQGVGYFSLATALSTAIAPSIGLWLMGRYNFRVLFLVAAAIAMAGTALGCITPLPRLKLSDRPFPLKHGLKLLLNKEAMPASVSMLFFMTGYGSISNFIALYGNRVLGLDNGGFFFICMAVTTFIMRLLAGRLSDRLGEAPAIYYSNASMILALLLLCFTPSLTSYVAAGLLVGSGYGLISPALQAMAMRPAPPERRGSASSTFLCSYDIGIGMGGLLGGLLVKYTSYTATYGLMSLAPALSLLLYFCWGRHSVSAFRVYQKQHPEEL